MSAETQTSDGETTKLTAKAYIQSDDHNLQQLTDGLRQVLTAFKRAVYDVFSGT